MSDLTEQASEKPNTSLLIRGAIWIAIGALIAAAIVCVVWVLIGDQEGLIARAFLTIVLLAAFAGIAIFEASMAPNRADWLSLLSMITWIIALLAGAVKIWLPEAAGLGEVNPLERFFQLVLIVGILQLALLHVSLFWKASRRYVTTFTTIVAMVTFVMLAALAGMLAFFLTFPNTFYYEEIYWRVVIALTILAAVGTTLIPLLNALFAPKPQRTAHVPVAAQVPVAQGQFPAGLAPWPMYADGVTPLPMLRDGSPDWNAYYTSMPTESAPAEAVVAAAAPTVQTPSLDTVAPPSPAPDQPSFPPAPPAAPMPPAQTAAPSAPAPPQ